MLKSLFRLLFWLNGWKVKGNIPDDVQQCVILAAPHTSNWDFIYGSVAYTALGLQVRFTIKHEWTRFPFGLIMNPLGAIGIDRSAKKAGEKRLNMVDEMVKIIQNNTHMMVMITPEGTRKPVKRWRSGFYKVATQANVPIALGFVDYGKKEAGIGETFMPTGDYDKDLRKILDFYNSITPCHPENYIKL